MMFDNLLGEFLGTMVLIVFGAGRLRLQHADQIERPEWRLDLHHRSLGFCRNPRRLHGNDLGRSAGRPEPGCYLGQDLIGIYSVPQFFATSIAQILGGILGAAIVWLAYLPHWLKRKINRQNSVSSARLRLSVTIRPTSFANLLRRSS